MKRSHERVKKTKKELKHWHLETFKLALDASSSPLSSMIRFLSPFFLIVSSICDGLHRPGLKSGSGTSAILMYSLPSDTHTESNLPPGLIFWFCYFSLTHRVSTFNFKTSSASSSSSSHESMRDNFKSRYNSLYPIQLWTCSRWPLNDYF